MKILIVYGTTEGQTRKLAHFIADRRIARGDEILIADAADSPPAPDGFDAVIVAASLHAGRYQAQVCRYVSEHREVLARRSTAFVSVSLSAAGQDPDDWAGLEASMDRFSGETGWTPHAIHHAAGAFRFTEYDFFKRLAMKLIAARRGQPTRGDYELTDYAALGAFVDQFAARAAAAELAPAGQGG